MTIAIIRLHKAGVLLETVNLSFSVIDQVGINLPISQCVHISVYCIQNHMKLKFDIPL